MQAQRDILAEGLTLRDLSALDEDVASQNDAFRSEHRSRFYYDIDRLRRDFAMAIHDLAEEIHQYLVEFPDAHSRCNCDEQG